MLAQSLREAITSGVLGPGDKLPSERTLAEQHGVARNTAREAVRLLAQEGLVRAEHGRGVFVRAKPRLIRFGRQRYTRELRLKSGKAPYRAEVEAQGRTPRVDCRSVEQVPADADVAKRLRIAEGTPVVRRENWYYADDEPMQLGLTFAPWSLVVDSPLGHFDSLGVGSVYGRFADLGRELAIIREEISARMPTPDEAKGLAIPEGVPVIDLWHTGMDADKNPFEVTRFVMRADFMGLDYDMPVEDR